MTKVENFRKVADGICHLYEAKNKAYGDSFGTTFQKLGIISAVTRISDKFNRLCNLATNSDIDNLGESIEDTLKDLAAYSIMTLIEYDEFLRNHVVNKQGDSDMTNTLTTAINNIKLLPFEMANGGYTNEIYCQVTEKFMERWKTIRDGVIQEVLREVDDEYIEEQKTKKRK